MTRDKLVATQIVAFSKSTGIYNPKTTTDEKIKQEDKDKFWRNMRKFGESFVDMVKDMPEEQYKEHKDRTNQVILYETVWLIRKMWDKSKNQKETKSEVRFFTGAINMLNGSDKGYDIGIEL
jgi:hypothetical protein